MLGNTRRAFAPFLLLLTAAAAAGCATSAVVNEREAAAPGETTPAETPATEAAASETPATEAPASETPASGGGDGKLELSKTGGGSATPAAGAKGSKADGDACDKADECSSGVCEGEGCGPGQGKCAAKERQCTLDLRAYCGCDGKTFRAGGNCPKARYSAKGACAGDPAPSIPGPQTIKKP